MLSAPSLPLLWQCVHLPDGRLALVAFRGLRVRMGLHTGLDDPEAVAFNRVASAYAYKGESVGLAWSWVVTGWSSHGSPGHIIRITWL